MPDETTDTVPDAVVLDAARDQIREQWMRHEVLRDYDEDEARNLAASRGFRAAIQSAWNAAQTRCTCLSWPPEGPHADCPTHGAVRAFNAATAEIAQLRQQLAEAVAAATEIAKARHEVLSWDWREQPDRTELARILTDLTDGRIKLYDVETESDQYAIVVTTGDLADEEVGRIYHDYLCGDDRG
jgi:hypothetical protein